MAPTDPPAAPTAPSMDRARSANNRCQHTIRNITAASTARHATASFNTWSGQKYVSGFRFGSFAVNPCRRNR